MFIYCKDNSTFHDSIYELLLRGVKFKADAEKYTIEITGGF